MYEHTHTLCSCEIGWQRVTRVAFYTVRNTYNCKFKFYQKWLLNDEGQREFNGFFTRVYCFQICIFRIFETRSSCENEPSILLVISKMKEKRIIFSLRRINVDTSISSNHCEQKCVIRDRSIVATHRSMHRRWLFPATSIGSNARLSSIVPGKKTHRVVGNRAGWGVPITGDAMLRSHVVLGVYHTHTRHTRKRCGKCRGTATCTRWSLAKRTTHSTATRLPSDYAAAATSHGYDATRRVRAGGVGEARTYQGGEIKTQHSSSPFISVTRCPWYR